MKAQKTSSGSEAGVKGRTGVWDILGGGGAVKWSSHMCDMTPEGAAFSLRGWWNIFIESNEADEKAIYGITFHLHFVQPSDQKTILIWGLHQ